MTSVVVIIVLIALLVIASIIAYIGFKGKRMVERGVALENSIETTLEGERTKLETIKESIVNEKNPIKKRDRARDLARDTIKFYREVKSSER